MSRTLLSALLAVMVLLAGCSVGSNGSESTPTAGEPTGTELIGETTDMETDTEAEPDTDTGADTDTGSGTTIGTESGAGDDPPNRTGSTDAGTETNTDTATETATANETGPAVDIEGWDDCEDGDVSARVEEPGYESTIRVVNRGDTTEDVLLRVFYPTNQGERIALVGYVAEPNSNGTVSVPLSFYDGSGMGEPMEVRPDCTAEFDDNTTTGTPTPTETSGLRGDAPDENGVITLTCPGEDIEVELVENVNENAVYSIDNNENHRLELIINIAYRTENGESEILDPDYQVGANANAQEVVVLDGYNGEWEQVRSSLGCEKPLTELPDSASTSTSDSDSSENTESAPTSTDTTTVTATETVNESSPTETETTNTDTETETESENETDDRSLIRAPAELCSLLV